MAHNFFIMYKTSILALQQCFSADCSQGLRPSAPRLDATTLRFLFSRIIGTGRDRCVTLYVPKGKELDGELEESCA
jgi:hypothetical protein